MDTKFITDIAFFIVTSMSLGAGGTFTAKKIHYELTKECLTTVQKGLPKLEPFTRALTKPHSKRF